MQPPPPTNQTKTPVQKGHNIFTERYTSSAQNRSMALGNPHSNAFYPQLSPEDKVLAWIQFLLCFVQKTLAGWSHWEVQRRQSPGSNRAVVMI